MKKQINWKKIMIKGVISCVILFLTYNVIWICNSWSYKKYIDSNFEVLSYSRISYLDENTDENLYGVKRPDYLSFTGNLYGVSSDNTISILWWPAFMSTGMDEIGVSIDVGRTGYSFYINESLEYHEEKNNSYTEEEEQIIKDLFESRKSEIQKLYNSSITRFGLESI